MQTPFYSRNMIASVSVALKHTLPELPYDYKALEPAISGEIMQIHHQKHHNTYVTNLNTAEEQLKEAVAKGQRVSHWECINNTAHNFAGDVAKAINLGIAIRFNGGGHINHSIFWQNLSPKGGGQPSGKNVSQE